MVFYYYLYGFAVSYIPQYLMPSIREGMHSDKHGMSVAYFGWLRLKKDRKQFFKNLIRSQSRFLDPARFLFCSPKGRGVKSACSVFFLLLIAVLTIKVLKSIIV